MAERQVDLVRYLPQQHRGTNVKKLLSLTEEELQVTSDFAITIGLQAGVDTATYGLVDWERMLNVPDNPTATLKDRRELVKSKLRSYGQATKSMIQNTAEAFSGGEVEIVEHIGEFRFTVKFVGTLGIPSNMDNFIEMLDKIKPAHLDYGFEYTYVTHKMLNKYTHSQLAQYTHSELREGVIE